MNDKIAEELNSQLHSNSSPTNNHFNSVNMIKKDFTAHKKNRNKHPKDSSNKYSKHPNKKRILQNQIEFYFSDVNLINDKFLKNLMKGDTDQGVDLKILLDFNKIKSLLQDVEDEKEKIKYVKKAIENSKKLKILNNKKVVRAEKFDEKKMNLKEIDNQIIYVENIPNSVMITHEILKEIFSKHGKVLHVSIPKFSENKQLKGFAFITFENPSEADKAIREGNNTIPREFISTVNTCSLDPLVIMSKNDWLSKKEEFKKLKQQLLNDNKELFAGCISQESSMINNLTPGTLVKLTNLPEEKKISKNEIRLWVSNFVEPAYVDLDENRKDCIVRFSHKILAETFNQKIEKEEDFKFMGKKLTSSILVGDEESKYFEKVRKLKEEYGKKKNKIKSKDIEN
jgi:RNA recognition motif-containing protein